MALLSSWKANTKRILAKDKSTGTEYEFESSYPDGSPDGTPFSAVEMNKIIDAVNGLEQYKGALGTTSLDNYKTSGVYAQTVSSYATSSRGYPVTSAGTLIVIAAGSTTSRIAQVYLVQSSNEIYYRRYVSSAWTDWVQLPAVEQGTSGIWTYRKYADGTAECWGTPAEISVASINSEWNGMYHYELSSGIAYPTGLFVARPVCTVGCHSSNFPGWIREVSPSNGITTAPGLWACTVASYTATTTMMFRPSYHAIGRWK